MSTKHSTGGVKTAESGSGGAARLASLRNSTAPDVITWAAVLTERWMAVIDKITQEGGLVSFSRTSDQGALMLYVKLSGDAAKLYAGSEFEASDMLAKVENLF